jgi:hypothetical protein
MGVMFSCFTPNVWLRDTLIQQIVTVIMFDIIDWFEAPIWREPAFQAALFSGAPL